MTRPDLRSLAGGAAGRSPAGGRSADHATSAAPQPCRYAAPPAVPIGRCGAYTGPILDFHTHLHLRLGRQPARPAATPPATDPLAPLLRRVILGGFEQLGYRYLIGRDHPLEPVMERVMARVLAAIPPDTANRLEDRLTACGVAAAVVLAIPPWAPNEAVFAACHGHPRLLPFFCPDPAIDPVPQLETALAGGARGFKLHPPLQRVGLDHPFVLAVARTAAAHRVPVVIHAGGTGRLFHRPRRGDPVRGRQDPADFVRLARRVPAASLVVAHAGLWEHRSLLDAVAGEANLLLDLSFQSTEVVARCLDRLGPHRLLLGSDGPLGRLDLAIRHLAAVPGITAEVTAPIVWDNAIRLLTTGQAFIAPGAGSPGHDAAPADHRAAPAPPLSVAVGYS